MKYRLNLCLLAFVIFVFAVQIPAETAGEPKKVKVPPAKGADVNARANNGDTALMMAYIKGHQSIVRILRDAGAK